MIEHNQNNWNQLKMVKFYLKKIVNPYSKKKMLF